MFKVRKVSASVLSVLQFGRRAGEQKSTNNCDDHDDHHDHLNHHSCSLEGGQVGKSVHIHHDHLDHHNHHSCSLEGGQVSRNH